MKSFCFTVDDNIRFLKEITEQGLSSIFLHPYPAMLRRLHDRFDLKVQLNLFYSTEGFDLSQMSDRYAAEWSEASNWLKLSFHSHHENTCPYEKSGYDEVFDHCNSVHKEILRFASHTSLADTTTIHFCKTTADGLRALSDNGVRGLLGLFGTDESPRISYEIEEKKARDIRKGEIAVIDGMAFASIDMIVNLVKQEDIPGLMQELLARDAVRVMIHEQYFYSDYKSYQCDFEEKLSTVFEILCQNGYKSHFFEEII